MFGNGLRYCKLCQTWISINSYIIRTWEIREENIFNLLYFQSNAARNESLIHIPIWRSVHLLLFNLFRICYKIQEKCITFSKFPTNYNFDWGLLSLHAKAAEVSIKSWYSLKAYLMLIRYCASATDSAFPVIVIVRSMFMLPPPTLESRSSQFDMRIIAPLNCLEIKLGFWAIWKYGIR